MERDKRSSKWDQYEKDSGMFNRHAYAYDTRPRHSAGQCARPNSQNLCTIEQTHRARDPNSFVM